MKGTRVLAAVAALAVGFAATACTSPKNTPSPDSSADIAADMGPHKPGGTVTIANTSGQTWTCQFNPFNPAVNQTSNGFVYEPLVFVNVLQNQAETPMLASSYEWNADKTSITFTIRDGVKWNDGQPFTAEDVVFTFELLKKESATDLYALWSGAGLQSVAADGNKVTLKFAQSAQPYFFNFAGQVVMVPKHVWGAGEAAASPATWANPTPVGTGPFTVDPCTPNNIQYKANPAYWQPGKPYIQTVQYPAYLDNAPANNDLASGKAQWGSQYIPGIENFYLNRSPDNHTWSPPVTNVAIIPNLDPSHPVTAKLEIRQAIASAIDRAKVAQIGEGGQQPAANQTGIVLPTFEKYYDGAAVTAAGYDKPDPAKATALLSAAGYTPANPLKLSIITVTGYTDWDASLAVIKEQLKAVGIDLTVVDLAQQTFNERLFNGDFDLAYYGQAGGPTPYYELRQILYSENTAPIGTAASTNFERYKNAEVDKLFDQYPTADDAGQVAIVKQIGAAMLRDVPIIPVTESVDWFQYNTTDIRGWPTAANPYAQPSAYNIPDVGQVLLHLYSKSAQN